MSPLEWLQRRHSDICNVLNSIVHGSAMDRAMLGPQFISDLRAIQAVKADVLFPALGLSVTSALSDRWIFVVEERLASSSLTDSVGKHLAMRLLRDERMVSDFHHRATGQVLTQMLVCYDRHRTTGVVESRPSIIRTRTTDERSDLVPEEVSVSRSA